MPNPRTRTVAARRLVPVDPSKAVPIAGLTTKKFSAKLPRRKVASSTEVQKALNRWAEQLRPPKLRSKNIKLKIGRLRASDFEKIRKIHVSPQANAEIINQKLAPERMIGIVAGFMSLMAYEEIRVEYKNRLRRARTTHAKSLLERTWSDIQKAGKKYFARAGLSNVRGADLDAMVRQMKSSRATYRTLRKIYSTRKVSTSGSLTSERTLSGFFGPQMKVGNSMSYVIEIGGTTDLCSEPLTGSLTGRAEHTFNLEICVWYWCPKWNDWDRWCKGCVNVAGVSIIVDVNINYSIDCDGMTAEGCGTIQACASALGVTKCASCKACVVGTAGVASSGSNDVCTYGFGLSLRTTCTVAGIPIFSGNTALTIAISAPCP